MIASWPGHVNPGSQSDHISAFWDVLPTLCDVADIDTPSDTDGISFLPALLGKAQTEHEFLYWEFPSYSGQQAVRMGDWKGLRHNIFKGNMDIQLYDLSKDTRESHDVAAGHPEIVKKMAEIMTREHVPATIERFQIKQLGD
jgi:arylsulfatase A-like enzyme